MPEIKEAFPKSHRDMSPKYQSQLEGALNWTKLGQFEKKIIEKNCKL